jgi:hypothetical protein
MSRKSGTFFYICCPIAQMAELVDALDSKSCYRKVVQVRFLFWAQKLSVKGGLFFVTGFNGSDSPALILSLRNLTNR